MQQLIEPDVTVTENAGLCLKMARRVYGIPAVWPSAWEAWLHAPGRATGDHPRDVSVPVWFSHYGYYGSPPRYGNFGHVVVYVPGRGYLSSPGVKHGSMWFQTIAQVETYFNARYVGWSEGINGVPVVAPQPVKRRRQEQIMNIVSYPHGGGRNVKRWYFSGPNYWLPIHVLETAKLLKSQYGIEVDSYECANLGELSKFKRAAVGSELDGDDVEGM